MNNLLRAEKSVVAPARSTSIIMGELLSWTAIILENHHDYKRHFMAKNFEKHILSKYIGPI